MVSEVLQNDEPVIQPMTTVEETKENLFTARPTSKHSKQDSDDFITKGKKRAAEGSVLVIGEENNDLISDN